MKNSYVKLTVREFNAIRTVMASNDSTSGAWIDELQDEHSRAMKAVRAAEKRNQSVLNEPEQESE